MFINTRGIVILTAIIGFFASCSKELSFENPPVTTGEITINFIPAVDNDTLVLLKTYQNVFGETFNVSAFKYYVHDVMLANVDSAKLLKLDSTGYYLVDAAAPASGTLTFNTDPYKYNAILFTLGVDSTENVDGPRTGALDPANQMFWSPTDGYIMAKLEGISPESTEGDLSFRYNIGGFRQAESVIKQIIIPLPEDVVITKGGKSHVTLMADVNAWFSGSHDIMIQQNSVCLAPGALAQQIADNYENMFRVLEVVNPQ